VPLTLKFWFTTGKEQRWHRENFAHDTWEFWNGRPDVTSKSPGSLLVKSTATMWVTKLQVIEYFMLWTEYIMNTRRLLGQFQRERDRKEERYEIWQMLQVKQWNIYNKWAEKAPLKRPLKIFNSIGWGIFTKQFMFYPHSTGFP